MKVGSIVLAAADTSSFMMQVVVLVAFIALMYFRRIRPQKKKEKQVNDMRNSLRVGDEIVTIGGICGKVVKTKDETLIIQVGADKTKFEVMRWSISSVTSPSKRPADSKADDEAEEESRPRRTSPRRLKKAAAEEEPKVPEKEAEPPKELPAESAEAPVENPVEE